MGLGMGLALIDGVIPWIEPELQALEQLRVGGEVVGMGMESVDPRGNLMATQTWRCAALPSSLSS